jgi:type II secretory pathway pseudopilin PulG
MIELLIVIAIIAILAALFIGAVTRVQERSREVRVRADMTSLETAVAAFKSKFGATVPCYGSGTNGTFQLCSYYTDQNGVYQGSFTSSSPEVVFLNRIFPRINLKQTTNNGVTGNGLLDTNGNQIAPTTPVLLDPNQVMVFFLSGGSFTNYTGFSTDPTAPFKPNSGSNPRLGGTPFFDFPKNRMVAPLNYTNDEIPSYQGQRFTNDTGTLGNTEPWFLDPWGNPYLYFSSNNGNDYPFDVSHPTMFTPLAVGPWGGQYSAFQGNNVTVTTATTSTSAPDGVRPYRESPVFVLQPTTSPYPWTTGAYKLRNPKTVQIISAGRDGIWGRGQQKDGYAIFPGVPADSNPPSSGFPENGYTGNQQPYAYSNSAKGGGDDFTNFAQSKLGNPE